MPAKSSNKTRCSWVGDDPLYLEYHDREWGVPLRDDRQLFEMLILEGAQAGLSWITILRKRENYRRAFDDFDVEKIAAFLEVADEYGSFSKYLWGFVDGKPIVNRWRKVADVPASTEESDALSKALKKRGFKFVGSTICYSYMQAVGMINDHTVGCFRYTKVSRARRKK